MPDIDPSDAGFPMYARNCPTGPTPKGIPIVDQPAKMANGLVKMAQLTKALPKRSLLRRLTTHPRTNRKRFF